MQRQQSYSFGRLIIIQIFNLLKSDLKLNRIFLYNIVTNGHFLLPIQKLIHHV